MWSLGFARQISLSDYACITWICQFIVKALNLRWVLTLNGQWEHEAIDDHRIHTRPPVIYLFMSNTKLTSSYLSSNRKRDKPDNKYSAERDGPKEGNNRPQQSSGWCPLAWVHVSSVHTSHEQLPASNGSNGHTTGVCWHTPFTWENRKFIQRREEIAIPSEFHTYWSSIVIWADDWELKQRDQANDRCHFHCVLLQSPTDLE
jgi:hypothetical protein